MTHGHKRAFFVRVFLHGSKLKNMEVFPILGNTFLTIEYWSTRINHYRKR